MSHHWSISLRFLLAADTLDWLYSFFGKRWVLAGTFDCPHECSQSDQLLCILGLTTHVVSCLGWSHGGGLHIGWRWWWIGRHIPMLRSILVLSLFATLGIDWVDHGQSLDRWLFAMDSHIAGTTLPILCIASCKNGTSTVVAWCTPSLQSSCKPCNTRLCGRDWLSGDSLASADADEVCRYLGDWCLSDAATIGVSQEPFSFCNSSFGKVSLLSENAWKVRISSKSWLAKRTVLERSAVRIANPCRKWLPLMHLKPVARDQQVAGIQLTANKTQLGKNWGLGRELS